MPQVTIIVEFEAVDGAGEEFTRLILDHARRSLNEEPGCLRFDVVRPIDDQGKPKLDVLVVNELYADEAAVTAHGATPRMAQLANAIGPLIKSRRRIMAHSVVEALPDEGIRPEDLSAANDD